MRHCVSPVARDLRAISSSAFTPEVMLEPHGRRDQSVNPLPVAKKTRGVKNLVVPRRRYLVLRKSSLRRLLLNQRVDLSGSLVFADNSPLPTLARSTPLPLRSESLLWDRIGLDRRLRLVVLLRRIGRHRILQKLEVHLVSKPAQSCH